MTVTLRKFMCALCLTLSCPLLGSGHPASGSDSSAAWTIMVYMNAKNNLECAALDNFADMATVGSSKDVNVIVELGRPKQTYGCGDDKPWSGVLRFHVEKGQLPIPKNAVAEDARSIPDLDMGSADTLSKFVEWSISKYRARRYMLIVWNHGQGWRFQTALRREAKTDASKGRALSNTQNTLADALGRRQSPIGGFRSVSFDDDSGNFLYNSDIQTSLKQLFDGKKLDVKKLDVMGFDACLMAMIETGYAMRDVAKVLVASEELEPAAGWNYRDWLQKLSRDAGSVNETSLGKMLVESYRKEYGDRLRTTLSAVALDKAAPIAATLSGLSDAMLANLDGHLRAIQTARTSCKNYGQAAPVPMQNPIDLQCFIAKLSVTGGSDAALLKATREVQDAIKLAVIANYASARIRDGYGSHGISIYFPANKTNFDKDIPDNTGYLKGNTDHQVDFVEHQRWSDFLSAYLSKN